jgi:hypothetical protein
MGTLMAAFERMRDAMLELKRDGMVKLGGGDSFREFLRIMGADQIDQLGRKYSPQ